MKIILERASLQDAEVIFNMQVNTFMPLLTKYQDYHANPANESIERAKERITNPNGGFHKIILEEKLVGAICISKKEQSLWISPMFISPDYQGLGIAQMALVEAETMFFDNKVWELATLEEEKRNCYLYEKMGYQKTGEKKIINDKATLIYYKKVIA